MSLPIEFSLIFLLNSANSVNHDKFQKMLTRDTVFLATDTFLVIVTGSIFSLPYLGRYFNRCLSKDSYRNLIFTTSFGNVSIVRFEVSLAIIPFLVRNY